MSFNRKTQPTGKAASEVGYTFEPSFPGGEGIGATVTVRGPESQVVRDMLRRQITALHKRETATKKSGREAEAVNIDTLEEQAVDMAVAYTITWSGFEDGDQPLPPTEANLRAIYTEHAWIRRQVIEEAQDLGNFVRPQSGAFSTTPPQNSALT